MIKLERFDEFSYDTLISWVDSEEALMQFAGPLFIFPLTCEQLANSNKDPRRHSFKVISLETGEMIAHAEIFVMESVARFGRILIGDEKLRGKGIGQEIIKQLLEYTINVLNQSKVDLLVFDWNIHAIKCYEKVGFIVNPEIRYERKVKGETWIALNMALGNENLNKRTESSMSLNGD